MFIFRISALENGINADFPGMDTRCGGLDSITLIVG